MKTNKKGFTLIELMVVIVIIGILAAIAIPKLFGMTAKAKASEVGPAAGTWSKLQQAYFMEKSKFGHWGDIAYKGPGTGTIAGSHTAADGTSSVYDPGYSKTSYFGYTDGVTANETESSWLAGVTVKLGDCPTSEVWTAKFENAEDNPIATPPVVPDCANLTPNFAALR